MFEHVRSENFNDNKVERFLRANIINLQRIQKNIFVPGVKSISEATECINNAITCLMEVGDTEGDLFKEYVGIIEKQKAKYRNRVEEQVDMIEEILIGGEVEDKDRDVKIYNIIKEIREILEEN